MLGRRVNSFLMNNSIIKRGFRNIFTKKKSVLNVTTETDRDTFNYKKNHMYFKPNYRIPFDKNGKLLVYSRNHKYPRLGRFLLT